MEFTIVTNRFTKDNLFDLKSDLILNGSPVKFLIQSPQEDLSPELKDLLDKWEKFRYQTNQATIHNDPYGFAENLLNSENTEESPCAFFLTDSGNLHAVIAGTVSKQKLSLGAKLHSPKLWTFCTYVSNYLLDEQSGTLSHVAKLFETLLSQKHLDYIELERVNQETEAYKRLKAQTKFMHFFEEDRKRWLRQLIDPVTKNKLEHGSKKTQSTQKRRIKKFHRHFEDNVELQTIKDVSDIDDFILAASNIVDQTYQRAIGVGVESDNEDFRKFFHKFAKQSLMRGYLLTADKKPIAYCVGSNVSGVFDLMATAYLPQYAKLAPGQVLFLMVFDQMIEDKIEVFDFGWGESNYKITLSSHNSHEVDIKLYSKRLKPSFTYFTQRFLKYLNKTVRETLGAERIAAFRKSWRKRLAKTDQ